MGKEQTIYAELTAMPLGSDWPNFTNTDSFRDRGVHVPSLGEVIAGQLILCGETVPDNIIIHCQRLLGKDGYHRQAFDVTMSAWKEMSTEKRRESTQKIFNAVAVQFASAFHNHQDQWLEYATIFSSAAYQMKAMAEAATPA